jgi:hypothetical protein
LTIWGGRRDVDVGHISVIGKGKAGVMALFAAVLEPRIERVTCSGARDSYLSLARLDIHEDNTDIVLPGVLRDFDLPDVAKALGARAIIE